MQHPKCRTCGDRHPLGPCPRFQTETVDLRDVKPFIPDEEVPMVCDGKEWHQAGPVHKVSPEEKAVRSVSRELDTIVAMTAAERQRRYREKHGDDYRKREAVRQKKYRERKRQEKRDGETEAS